MDERSEYRAFGPQGRLALSARGKEPLLFHGNTHTHIHTQRWDVFNLTRPLTLMLGCVSVGVFVSCVACE